jgi:hypothetical protein
MINIQHTKLKTHGGWCVEVQVDPSLCRRRCFYSELNMTLECKDIKFDLFVGASQCLYLERQNK